MIRLALAIGLLLAVSAPSAHGDADPASDVLLGQDAFYPYQPPVTRPLETAMEKVLSAAGRAGLPLKVAVIGSREDLGAIPNLFGHPQQYAEFLDREISFNNRPPLLVVMPAGFGVVAAGPPNVLAGFSVDARHGSYGLVSSAIDAVVVLVRAHGGTISRPVIPPNGSSRNEPPVILLFLVPIALLVICGAGARSRRHHRHR